MKSLYERLCFAYEGGLVRRFHTRPGIEPCTDAHHSHGVAMLCYFLSDGLPSQNLLLEALTHDLGEHFAGDIPAPTKWVLGAARFAAIEEEVRGRYELSFPLTVVERRTLAIADAMEGVLWCAKEVSMGNVRARRPGEKWIERVRKRYAITFTDSERSVYNAVAQIWRECNEEGSTRYDIYAE